MVHAGATIMANYKLNFTVLLFLKLLTVVFSGDKEDPQTIAKTFNYDRQVVVLLEGDYAPTKAAKYLYRAHKKQTDIVRWNDFGKEFFGLKIDGNVVLIDDRKSLVNVEDWTKTRVYVITHGSTNDQNFGSFTAEKLHDIIFNKLVPLGPPAENIKRISLVGCTESSIGNKEAPPFFNKFKEELLKSGNRKTEISIRSGLVTVDFQGRKLVGKRIAGGNIEWKHSKQERSKWVYKPDKNKVVNEHKELTFPNPPITGLLFATEPVYVENTAGVDINGFIRKRCKIGKQNALDWVKEKSDELFNSKDTEPPKIFERNKDVHMLFNRELKIKETDQIKEIHNMKAFLHELVHYGTNGPLKTGEFQYTYYRIGDWIVRMNLKTFYMHTVGIIDDGSPKVKEFIDWADKNHKQNLEEDHVPMRNKIDKKSYFTDAEKWITGKPDDEIEIRSKKVNLAKAYNAQSIAAVFLSEAIRCFHTHITNMMSLQLARNGYLEVDQFLETHPMARGSTWQLKYEGTKVTGLQMLLVKSKVDDINM